MFLTILCGISQMADKFGYLRHIVVDLLNIIQQELCGIITAAKSTPRYSSAVLREAHPATSFCACAFSFPRRLTGISGWPRFTFLLPFRLASSFIYQQSTLKVKKGNKVVHSQCYYHACLTSIWKQRIDRKAHIVCMMSQMKWQYTTSNTVNST